MLAVAFSSCRHRDFCLHDPALTQAAAITIQAHYRLAWEIPHIQEKPYGDWRSAWPSTFPMDYDELMPIEPTGLRIIAFHNFDKDPEGKTATDGFQVNLPSHGGTLNVDVPGDYSLLLFNNDTEYIKFEGLETYATTMVTTRSRTRTTYSGNPFYQPRSANERTLNPPDMIYGNFVPEIHIAVTQPESRPVKDVEMQPLVFTYVVEHTIEKGREHITSARGALAGMAEGVWLSSGNTTDEAATLLYECELTANSVIATVRSFGVPGWPKSDYGSRSQRQYALNLELCLSNGKVVRYDYDVTDQVERQPRGGVIRVGGISVDAEEATAYGSGFQVDVTDWGENEVIQF